MYSGTLGQQDLDIAKLQQVVPDLHPSELVIGHGIATVTRLPFEAPWLSALGACLIMVTSIRRRGDSGELEFQLGGEDAVPYDNGEAWCKAGDFYSEWPK